MCSTSLSYVNGKWTVTCTCGWSSSGHGQSTDADNAGALHKKGL